MSFGSRLTHTVSIIRRSDSGSFDDYNHPIRSESVLATVKVAIQPRLFREGTLTDQGGAVSADHVIYLFPTDLNTGDAILHDASACPLTDDLPTGYFEVKGVPNAAGIGHHLEVAAQLVAAPASAEGS